DQDLKSRLSQSAEATRSQRSSAAQETFLVRAADEFILSVGDRYLDRLALTHRKQSVAAPVLLGGVPDLKRRGVVEGNSLKAGVFRISSAVEKPQVPRTYHAMIPVFMFTDQIFHSLSGIPRSSGGEDQLTDAIHGLIASGSPVIGVMFTADERQLDFGTQRGS